ncbi:hypothetical protein [Nocardioides dongkuii]|uniref:hypothetical protein n=1 Tax=Nocardioides dongkuii TaxID=2760089 RepID=UPI0015F97667|nr:hypothetical protein [Nocardioides dongkuii]
MRWWLAGTLLVAALTACSSSPPSAEPCAPPADLREQGDLAERVGGYAGDGYRVRWAASSAVGLVALVEGDVDRARTELEARGVALVEEWDEKVAAFAQVERVLEAAGCR